MSESNARQLINRLKSERERLGLTVAQFAVLAGVSKEHQTQFESGDFTNAPMGYDLAIKRLGVDPEFLYGHSNTPVTSGVSLVLGDDDFDYAVSLFRKSKEVVEAFVGAGAAKDCPELVAAIMSATIQSRCSVGAGNLEDFTVQIANSIEAAGSVIADAISDALDQG